MATRFAADQQRREIVTAGFGRGRNSVWRRAIPGRNHRIDPLIQRFGAQVGAPRERRDDHVSVIARRRVDAHADVADED